MIKPTFNKGNYNDWDNLVTKIFPKTLTTIRQEFLTTLDNTLLAMLGNNPSLIKDSIDVNKNFENKDFTSISIIIHYIVNEFNVPTAPQKAIDSDINTIKEQLLNIQNIYNLSVDIDTTDGQLIISFDIKFRF